MNTAIGAFLGHRRWLTIAGSVVANPLLFWGWGYGFEMVISTYDHFHFGILSGQLAFEFVGFPFTRQLESAHASLVYLAVLVANALLLRLASGTSLGGSSTENGVSSRRGAT